MDRTPLVKLLLISALSAGLVVPHLPQKFAVKGKGLWHCEQFITGSLVLLDVI